MADSAIIPARARRCLALAEMLPSIAGRASRGRSAGTVGYPEAIHLAVSSPMVRLAGEGHRRQASSSDPTVEHGQRPISGREYRLAQGDLWGLILLETPVRNAAARSRLGVELAMMTDEQVQNAVASAIESLKAEAPALDFESVHERSTAHRLAVQLEPHFKMWNVDCEYDRDGQLKKTLLGIAQCDSRKATDGILPDIIVHHRRGQGRDHNLLVVELKKDVEEDVCDKRKLELLTSPYGQYQYCVGLYINIAGGKFACTWYKDGAQSS
jgi:hypothetical protein